MTDFRLRPWWRLWLAAGIAAAVAYALLPYGWLSVAVSTTVSAGSCALMVAGVRAYRPASRNLWYVFAAGIALWVLGDLIYAWQLLVLRDLPYPSWADACYLGAYPLLTLALFRLTRQGSVRSGSLIDSAIIAVAVGIAYWTFLIEPVVTDTTTPPLVRTAAAANLIVGVLLCAVITPILLRRGSRTPSLWLLTAGSAITLACNIGYALLPAALSYTGQLVFAGYLTAYAFWAAAALHPSMSRPAIGTGETLGRSRLIVLTASMLMVPAILLVQGERAGGELSWAVIGVGSMALFVLVATRMSGYIARVDTQARQLRELAMRDDLTGLPNRRDLERRAAEAVADGNCQLVMIDLAGFKHVNDRLGRAVGDQALIAVAGLLHECVREGDVVARMGADEFAVLVRDTLPGDGDTVSTRLMEMLRRPVQAGEHELLLNARLGVAEATGDINAIELIRRADTARYAAKATGGQLVAYGCELDERAEAAERLGADLRHSLDDGDFRVFYQPIVELRGGRIAAVEALVRWDHPVRGPVSPAAFIPVAEDNGLIVELGEWVMRTACRQFATWCHELGDRAPEYVSVNVSARQLNEPGFPDVVIGILAETGVAPNALLVEVTETALFAGQTAIEAVETLHRSGIGIALDDFGTGHSSLGLLRTVPVDVLKVDKSFVDEITTAGRRAVIVDALIHVSNGLGLRAVAEGVETAEQAAYLRDLGYPYAQGYHFGRPVPEPSFEPYVEPAVRL
ncbi:putative bifunctional diguanylate cyclase/phosphodiesterase [Actinoplanes aureus]|uniref:putative bifunctional diguanylate cyclase/phosphodiesterase n=1 Tax=Actinoplanes aureus TaxID=2792083 RepID=UPI0028155C67|nr:EAL domain-containing protein [Actinoplanes aureus]